MLKQIGTLRKKRNGGGNMKKKTKPILKDFSIKSEVNELQNKVNRSGKKYKKM